MHLLNLREIDCFSPEPSISWIGPRNTIAIGRYSADEFEFNTTLKIYYVTPSDEGNYSCIGSNAQGNSTHTFQLRVEGQTFKT